MPGSEDASNSTDTVMGGRSDVPQMAFPLGIPLPELAFPHSEFLYRSWLSPHSEFLYRSWLYLPLEIHLPEREPPMLRLECHTPAGFVALS